MSGIEPYYLQCVTNVEVFAVNTSQLHLIPDKLLNRVEQIKQLSDIIQHSNAKDRLWNFLQWLKIKFGKECSAGQVIAFPLTEQELADILGVSTSVTSCILSQFQRQNLIFYSEAKYIVFTMPVEQKIEGET